MMLYLKNVVDVVDVVDVTLDNQGIPSVNGGNMVDVGGCKHPLITSTFLSKISSIFKGYIHYIHFLTFSL